MSTLKSKNQSNGIGLGNLLTVIFIVLKLTDLIDWSWFWVFFPIILNIGLILLFLTIAVLAALIVKLSKK
jgi:hypothetical protein